MFKVDLNKVSKGQLNKMLRVASRLKKLSANEFSGWADYCLLLETYSNNLLEHKKRFDLSMASDEQIDMLRLYDRDIWLINNFIKKVPYLFIDNLESEIKRRKEEADMPGGEL